MINISHRQTTAYYPESNGAVKRLHRLLKDALRARAAAATWSEELPFVLLGLRAQRAASRAPLCPLIWVRCGAVVAPLQLFYDGRSALWFLLLHHLSQVRGRGHRRQPPQGLHGSGR
jgi:hypothetical protein